MDLSGFKIEDIFQLAATIEQGGFEFYGKLMESCEDARVRNELRDLREQELVHRSFFLGQMKKGTSAAPLPSELDGWLRAEFVQPMEDFHREKGVGREADALRLGMALEQKTIDLYVGMRTRTRDAATLTDLDRVIEEERRHKQRLNALLRLSGPGASV